MKLDKISKKAQRQIADAQAQGAAQAIRQEKQNEQNRKIRSVQKLHLVHPRNVNNSNPPTTIDLRPFWHAYNQNIGKSKDTSKYITIFAGMICLSISVLSIPNATLFAILIGLVGIPLIALPILSMVKANGKSLDFDAIKNELRNNLNAYEMKSYGVSTEKQNEFIYNFFGFDLPVVHVVAANEYDE